ncbi:MAG: putative transport system permease protein [Verrucomicrobiota bacterium]|jgi:putative ABC transport system permease protein
MKTPLAWRNVSHKKVRSLVALCGISFAILLIFMQLGFYAAARNSATSVYNALDFDLLVLSPQYVFVARPSDLSRSRLEQVRAIPGVSSVVPVWMALGEWRNPETRERWNILTLGVDPAQRPFRDSDVNDRLSLLMPRDTALMDSLARPEQGRLAPGVHSEVQHHRIRIVGQYAIGGGFVAGATLVTSRETFLEVFQQASGDRINVGLVKIASGASARIVAQEIKARLWPIATALTRAESAKAEQNFWLTIKPIGIMFTSGVLVAFVAGAVILYQVLASEVQNRLREYATLKALGYDTRFVYGIVVRQALIFSGLGFVPAFFFALGLYFLLRTQAMVPVTMELPRVLGVLFLTFAMGVSASFLAIRKVSRADPAELF